MAVMKLLHGLRLNMSHESDTAFRVDEVVINGIPMTDCQDDDLDASNHSIY